jgi:hypothetical protein
MGIVRGADLSVCGATHARGNVYDHQQPPGATVEIDGLVVGTTPYRTDYPSGHSHKRHMVFATRLDHAMVLRLSKDGFATSQVNLTEGPCEWIAATGWHEGNYFLMKSSHIDAHLDEAPQASRGTADARAMARCIRRVRRCNLQAETARRRTESPWSPSPPRLTSAWTGISWGKRLRQSGGRAARAAWKCAAERQTWSRSLDVLTGSQVTLRAKLEQNDGAESAPRTASKSN